MVSGILTLASVLLAGPPLQVPWTCGVTKPCTQGHGGFSHTGNSLYAWDFDVDEGEEVWAASGGTVSYIRMDSTTGGCDPSYGGDANYVVVAHDDGTAIMYMHLAPYSSPLAVGDVVRPGMLIGRVGLTGYVCGDHLHLAVTEQCGSPYCQSVPATFADYGDPAEGDSIESTNCPACTLVLDGTQTTIDELEPGCFVRQTTAWWSTMSGEGDHHFFTIATDDAAPASTGVWSFGVTVPGDYQVEVFVPDEDANATGAVYQVQSSAGLETFPIDQSVAKGWQALGVFAFSGAEGERIELADNTGEAVALDRRLGYDAVRLTFVPSAGESGGSDDDGDTSTNPSTADDGGSASNGGDESTTDDATTGVAPGTDEGGGPVFPDGYGEQDDGGGCGCATSRRNPTTTTLGCLTLFVLAHRRRRRAPRLA